jgi:hypothetical protein
LSGGYPDAGWDPGGIPLPAHEDRLVMRVPDPVLVLGSIPVRESYTLNFGGATGGTATVSVDGHGPSATIAFNAANSVVKTAIVGIDDGIVAADVTVTGSAGVYTVTVPGVLTVDGASLTGGSAASVTRV